MTPSDASGDTFTASMPQPISNLDRSLTLNFSFYSGTVSGTPVPDPPADPTPTPTPPAIASGSATNCNDVSGTWVGPATSTYSLSQSGTSVTGTVSISEAGCGLFAGTVQGQATGTGSFSLTVSGPPVDACGYPITDQQATISLANISCSQAQATISDSGTGASGFLGSGGSASGGGGITTWTRQSSPPGLQLAFDLGNGKATAQLTGQNKAGNLNIVLNGAGGSTTIGNQNGAAAGSSPQFTFQRSALNPGQYTSAVASWDNLSVSVPVSFNVIGPTRFSTYNVPIENSCSGTGISVFVFENDTRSCLFYQGMIKSDFFLATDTNGTGLSNLYGLLKPYDTTWLARYCPLPTAIGATHGKSGNTFVRVGSQVSETTGACNSTISFGNSVAVNPDPTSGAQSNWACKDNLLLVNPNNDQTDSIKVIQDYCPVCSSDFRGQSAHIDTFSSYQSCSGHSASDYGNFTAIRLR